MISVQSNHQYEFWVPSEDSQIPRSLFPLLGCSELSEKSACKCEYSTILSIYFLNINNKYKDGL